LEVDAKYRADISSKPPRPDGAAGAVVGREVVAIGLETDDAEAAFTTTARDPELTAIIAADCEGVVSFT